MSRLPLIEYRDARDPQVLAVYDSIIYELGVGKVPALFKAMAAHPTILTTNWTRFQATVLTGLLPRTLKEMIGIIVTHHYDNAVSDRPYLNHLMPFGVSQELIENLIHDFDSCPLPQRDKIAIRFGVKVAVHPKALTQDDYDELRTQGLNNAEIIELVATADLFVCLNIYANAAGLETRDDGGKNRSNR